MCCDRCEARQMLAKKVENVNGSWGNRKMEGTFVVIPGTSSVILPNRYGTEPFDYVRISRVMPT